ncbi:MAG TPA: hypothetical protein VGT06_12805 [Candidatus Methylomirabilis sp.]|jgi:hypothetical protein|nr:hypothetical protein [Candidatus Methylomirabilis sp.]
MRLRWCGLLVIGLFLFAPVSPAAALPFVEVWGEARYWRPILESVIVASAPGFPGTTVDPVTDLGVEEEQNAYEARAGLTLLGRHKFRIGYLPLSFDGDRTLTQNITFQGETFTATTRVLTDLDVKILRAGYQFDFFKTPLGYMGILFEVHYFDGEARLRDDTGGQDEKVDFRVPVPVVGLAFRTYPTITRVVSVGAELVGVYAGSTGHYLDGEASITISPFPFVEITGGYRVIDLEGEDGDDSLDLFLHGPFASITLRF